MKRRQMNRLKKKGWTVKKNAIQTFVNSATLLVQRWSLLLKIPNHTLMCSALRMLKR